MADTDPYEPCRCLRMLVCSGCDQHPEQCDCSNLDDDLLDDAQFHIEDDVADLDPLTRVLLGLPSGIRCGTGDA